MGLLIFEKQERHSTRCAVGAECQVVAEPGFSLLSRRTLDVSIHGMLAVSDDTVPVGTPLYVSLRIPGTRLWLDAEAETMRLLQGRRTGEWTRAIGLRFTRMDATDRALLQGHLWGRPPVTPSRPPRRDYATTIRRIAVG